MFYKAEGKKSGYKKEEMFILEIKRAQVSII
jgi:hypothetical protein